MDSNRLRITTREKISSLYKDTYLHKASIIKYIEAYGKSPKATSFTCLSQTTRIMETKHR